MNATSFSIQKENVTTISQNVIDFNGTNTTQKENVTVTQIDHVPENALDSNISTYFALQGGQKDGWWRAEFLVKQTKVIQVQITTSALVDR